MPVMFCNFDMFNMNAQVFSVDENDPSKSTLLYSGNFEDICNFIATEYQSNKYNRVVLSGPYAEAVKDKVLTYSKSNYNFNEMSIEVL